MPNEEEGIPAWPWRVIVTVLLVLIFAVTTNTCTNLDRLIDKVERMETKDAD